MQNMFSNKNRYDIFLQIETAFSLYLYSIPHETIVTKLEGRQYAVNLTMNVQNNKVCSEHKILL